MPLFFSCQTSNILHVLTIKRALRSPSWLQSVFSFRNIRIRFSFWWFCFYLSSRPPLVCTTADLTGSFSLLKLVSWLNFHLELDVCSLFDETADALFSRSIRSWCGLCVCAGKDVVDSFDDGFWFHLLLSSASLNFQQLKPVTVRSARLFKWFVGHVLGSKSAFNIIFWSIWILFELFFTSTFSVRMSAQSVYFTIFVRTHVGTIGKDHLVRS